MTEIEQTSHSDFITIPALCRRTGVPENVWRRLVAENRLTALYSGSQDRRGIYYVRLVDAEQALAAMSTARGGE